VIGRSRTYEITIEGQASESVRAEFDDVEVTVGAGVTCLRTGQTDQTTLFELLARMEALGLTLLEIKTAERPA
jgi:hypothetical protein